MYWRDPKDGRRNKHRKQNPEERRELDQCQDELKWVAWLDRLLFWLLLADTPLVCWWFCCRVDFLKCSITSLSFTGPVRIIWLAKFLFLSARDWKREASVCWLPEWEVGYSTFPIRHTVKERVWLLESPREKRSMFTGSYLSGWLRNVSFIYTYTEKEK